ncbi:MAG: hypothetical protein HQM08_05045 [Candidatus Riflebacteria bacterium]|nr:hypothetical protein [Candidatus Riflebacteria bacterium]
MKKNSQRYAFLKKFVLFTFFVIFSNSLLAQHTRFTYMGSSLCTMPTGYCSNGIDYIYDHDQSMTLLQVAPLGKYLEISDFKTLMGSFTDKNIFNFKLNILEEDDYIPNVVWGISDFRESLGPKITFFAASKKFKSLGLLVNGGMVKDPVLNEQKYYYGAEKTLYSSFSIAGEHTDDKTIVGLKMKYNGLTAEYARYLNEGSDNPSIIKLSYNKSFQ